MLHPLSLDREITTGARLMPGKRSAIPLWCSVAGGSTFRILYTGTCLYLHQRQVPLGI